MSEDKITQALSRLFEKHRIVFWYDANQDGQWELWIDREEKGRLVDVTRYDWRQGDDLLTLYPDLRNPT